MKQFILFILAAAALLGAGTVAQAEEQGSTEVTAAVKAWRNEWRRNTPASGRSTSDSIVLIGPVVEASFSRGLALEASYLKSLSAYKLPEAGGDARVDRGDLDLAIGREWFDRRVGFFVGYRNASLKERETGAKESSYGLTYSVRGSVGLRENNRIYGSLTWLNTRSKVEGQAREEAPGWIYEIGWRAAFTENLSVKLGYRWETTKSKDSQVKDTFMGTTLGVAWMF